MGSIHAGLASGLRAVWAGKSWVLGIPSKSRKGACPRGPVDSSAPGREVWSGEGHSKVSERRPGGKGGLLLGKVSALGTHRCTRWCHD